MNEEQRAKELAERVLSDSMRDPDSDVSVLARQFVRTLDRLQKAEEELLAIQQEEVRRIRHLNRLGTWAQQDPTGPIVRDQIQAWVLAELKAALGSAYEPTSWQPETAVTEQLQDRLQKAEGVLKHITTMPYPEEDDDFTTLVAMCKQALHLNPEHATNKSQ